VAECGELMGCDCLGGEELLEDGKCESISAHDDIDDYGSLLLACLVCTCCTCDDFEGEEGPVG
jgi:hypothetical protein